jgi:hypothetical protein
MLDAVRNKLSPHYKSLFDSQDLPGEYLLTPLKSYNQFFVVKTRENSEWCKRTAWTIAHVVTGIFAYPIFGLLALVGMAVKWSWIPSLQKVNESALQEIESVRRLIRVGGEYGVRGHSLNGVSGPRIKVLQGEFKVTRGNFEQPLDAAKNEIQKWSKQLKSVWLETNGRLQAEEREDRIDDCTSLKEGSSSERGAEEDAIIVRVGISFPA